jgi:hypothetical protein
MSTYARERALERIADVAGKGHDLVTLWDVVSDVLNPALPNFQGPCWFTLDLAADYEPLQPRAARGAPA